VVCGLVTPQGLLVVEGGSLGVGGLAGAKKGGWGGGRGPKKKGNRDGLENAVLGGLEGWGV